MVTFKPWKKVLLLCVLVLFCVTYLNGTHKVSEASIKEISINPQPQKMKVKGEGFSLPSSVGIVVGQETDEHAVEEVVRTLKAVGVNEVVQTKNSGEINTEVKIWVGGPSENPSSQEQLDQMDVKGPDALNDEGYVIASTDKEQKQIVLAGKDKTGTYYAAQTFKQIIQDKEGGFPQIEIHDWPEMPIRGSIEGFYGPPWSHEDRLSQLDFYGDNKLDTYIYAPKDDPYHREDWREPYPDEELDKIKALINKAKENHVNFTFSLSPGQSICYSGDKDFSALKKKMDTMWDQGVRSYAIFLDDISKNFHCKEDREKFGNDDDPIAAAHAYLLNRFNKEFIQTHKGADRLITVPTDYSGSGKTTYRDRFADLLNEDTVVMWTGPKVVSEQITSEGAEETHNIFKHDLLLWDNYPTNDYDRNSLFLGPLVKRDADLTDYGVQGLTANPMNEAEASKIPLYTVADYTWNLQAYDPEVSWARSIQSFGGDAADVLEKFAENTYSSPLNETESLTLKPLIESFWEAYTADGDAKQEDQALIAEFEVLQEVPAKLQNQMENEKFLQEIDSYLRKLKDYGESGKAAVQYLMAEKNENTKQANKHKENLIKLFNQSEEIPQKMGQGVIKPFLIKSALKLAPLKNTLQPSIDQFEEAKKAGNPEEAAHALMAEFKHLQQIANNERENIDDEAFLKSIEHYLQNLSAYSEAGEVAVEYVMAQEDNETEQAEQYKNELRGLLVQVYQGQQKIGAEVIKPFLIDTMWNELNVVDYRKLDGVNEPRGGGELIQYTSEYGETTGANQWGYEVTVENGVVTKKEGSNSTIPDNGYVLSIHGSDWLRDNATVGAYVQIKNGIVLVTNPAASISSASDLLELVQTFKADGSLVNNDTVRSLEIHLNAVKRFEKVDKADKVVKHMQGFQKLLDYHKENEMMSEQAYKTLKEGGKTLVKKWK